MSGDNKIKKRVTFYGFNHDTKVEELKLLQVATDMVGGGKLSVEDFIRGAALDVAARMVIREQMRLATEAQAALKEQEKETQDGVPSETQAEQQPEQQQPAQDAGVEAPAEGAPAP
jgi:hypothetical protein